MDIAKITPKDITAEDISGGYLLRIDKISDMEPYEYWESTVVPPFPEKHRIIYQFFDPDYHELTGAQREYVKGYLKEFEEVLVDDNFKDLVSGPPWDYNLTFGNSDFTTDHATQLISDPMLKVFPNPSDLSQTYLSLSQFSASELTIRIYDLSGKRVYQSEVFYSGSEYAFPLPNLSLLPSGIYTLGVTDGQSLREITKLLKQ